jgi:hypothetical protein
MQTHIRKVIGVSFAAAAPVIFGPNAAVALAAALAAAHAALTSNSAAHDDAHAHNGARGAHLGAAHLDAAHLGAFDAFEEAKEELALLHLGTDHLWGKGAAVSTCMQGASPPRHCSIAISGHQ